MKLSIRPMRREDNAAYLSVIQECVREFGYFDSPYITDPAESDIMRNYTDQRSRMYVVEDEEGRIMGGGGFNPVKGKSDFCEIKQVYFSPRIRGLGMGKMLLARLMMESANFGFRAHYIETVPEMAAAIRLYESMGFTRCLRVRTDGHNCCSVFMQRPIEPDWDLPLQRSA